MGSGRIGDTMLSVADVAGVTREGSAETRTATSDLARMAGELNALVGNFRY